MFNKSDYSRNEYMLTGSFKRKGYDWWWHSFTAVSEKTGMERQFFIEFFLINPALGGKNPVFGQLPENKTNKVKPSYLMVKAGCWGDDHTQLHRFFGWDDVTVSKKSPYSVSAKDCFASDKKLKGSICILEEESKQHPEWMCDFGEIEFDLTIDKQIAYNVGYGAGKLFRDIKAYEMYWHAEGIKSLYEGYIVFNNERFIVSKENSFGYADKNWGRGFTSPWVWISSNSLTSNITGKKLNNSAYEVGGGKPKIYFISLNRKLLGGFYYEGKEYEYNFSKFWTGSKVIFSSEETDDKILWHLRQENHKSICEVEVSCLRKDMLLVNYEAPDGSKRHNRLWNGGNGIGNIKLYKKTKNGPQLIDDVYADHIGCEYGEYDR